MIIKSFAVLLIIVCSFCPAALSKDQSDQPAIMDLGGTGDGASSESHLKPKSQAKVPNSSGDSTGPASSGNTGAAGGPSGNSAGKTKLPSQGTSADAASVSPEGSSGKPRTRAELAAAKESLIRGIIEATQARQMPDRLIETTFDKLLTRRDAVADDVASALDETMLPQDLSPQDKARMHNEMFKAGKQRLEQTRGYLDKLEIPKFVVVVLHHLLEENYTDQELEQLLTFWQSPVGKKTINLLPSMTESFVELAHQYFPPKLEEVQNQMIKDVENRGRHRR